MYVRRSSAYYESLTELNTRLAASGRKPVNIVPAEENLEDEDILEMVNAGLVDATVVDSYVANFWKEIFPKIQPQPAITLRSNAQIAWAIRKDSPELKKRLDAFVAKNRMGTMMGNVVLKRYLQNTRWAKGATKSEDMKRFTALTEFFKKYATKYDFDWLLVAAQAYQESGLDQSTRSPVGAIGVMQVMPTTAKDKNVGIPNIQQTEPNIHAGVKYLRFLVNQYFDEPGIDRVNRHLFAFAVLQRGPEPHLTPAPGGRRTGTGSQQVVQQRRNRGRERYRPRDRSVREQHLQVLRRVQADAGSPAAARTGQVEAGYLTV